MVGRPGTIRSTTSGTTTQWTDHGHGQKVAGLFHYPNTHVHCYAGPSSGGSDGRVSCEDTVANNNHQSYHDAPVHSGYNCSDYGDGHGICPHWMEPNS